MSLLEKEIAKQRLEAQQKELEQKAAEIIAEEDEKAKIKPALKSLLNDMLAEDYWTKMFSPAEVKKIRKVYILLILGNEDAILNPPVDGEFLDSDINWDIIPRPETDQEDDWEGVQSIFMDRCLAGGTEGLVNGLTLIQKLASSSELRAAQGWNDGSKIAWYRVAQDAFALSKDTKAKVIDKVIMPSIATGWMPESTNPSEWVDELKAFAQAELEKKDLLAKAADL